MNCQETQKLIHAYVDNELDLVKNLEIEQHLQECPGCAQAHQALQALRTTIKTGTLYYEPSRDLEARIRAAVGSEARGGSNRSPLRSRWLALAASLVLALIAGWTVLHFFPARASDAFLTEELLASHVRSQMLPGHRVDVESSDQHTVKPWFHGKLDFSPPVQDFAGQGFPLVGGRLDYVDHRPVAALVYQRRKHLINLYMWPSPQDTDAATQMSARQGYNLFHWTKAGMTYRAISDLNQTELEEFVGLVRGKDR